MRRVRENGPGPVLEKLLPGCEGGGSLYDITTTSNLVEHATIGDDGTEHFTFSVTGKGSDGSKLRNTSVDHFNQRPDGTVSQFYHCR